MSEVSQEAAVSLIRKSWCLDFRKYVRAQNAARHWPGSPQMRLPKQDPQPSPCRARGDVISMCKQGGASLSGASGSAPSLYVDGNQGPERGRHLLKATQYRAGRTGVRARSKPVPVFPPLSLTTAGLSTGCQLNKGW